MYFLLLLAAIVLGGIPFENSLYPTRLHPKPLLGPKVSETIITYNLTNIFFMPASLFKTQNPKSINLLRHSHPQTLTEGC